MSSPNGSGQWIERDYVLSNANWQKELHQLISAYILTCRERGDGGPVQRGRCIKIETSLDGNDGTHLDGPEIKVPMTSVCADCFHCCRKYMVEPLVPFFERHFPNSQVLVIKIHYNVEDDKLPYLQDVEDSLDAVWAANLQAMQIDEVEESDGDDDTEMETDSDESMDVDDEDDELYEAEESDEDSE